MDFLLNQDFVYLLLAGGMALGVLALASPGTGLIELGAVSLLVAAGWLIAAYQLPVNLWSLGVILVGVALFAYALHHPRQHKLLALSISALVLGSAYLFAGELWWQPGVNPLLAVIVSILLVGFFWLAARKVIEADQALPSHDLTTLIGAVGEARTQIDKEGSVFVEGELWSARSDEPIPDGAEVRILSREGLILNVEPINPQSGSKDERN